MKVNYNIIDDGRFKTEDEILQGVFKNRNIIDVDSFLRPSKEDMLPFSAFKNIEKAYNILYKAIKLNSPILILADTDVDGVTSCSIIYRYLNKICKKGQVSYTIPEAKSHGVEKMGCLSRVPSGLLIVVDSIDGMELYKRILDLGYDIICLDHHLIPSDTLLYNENNFALVSSANEYPNPDLSGAGVCLKFCSYIDYQNLTNYADDLYDLAACGLIADMSSMLSKENRYIVSKGFNKINNLAIRKIIGNYEFNSTAVSFSIAPKVNACVRMGKGEYALMLFAEDDEELIDKCVSVGTEAKDTQSETLDEIMKNIEPQIENQKDCKTIFIETDPKYKSISGVIANKVLAIVQRPVIVFHINEKEKAIGSMRAVGLENFSECVNNTGLAECRGHELSAGFFGYKENMKELKDSLELMLKDIEFHTDVDCDVLITAKQLTDSLIRNVKIINRISGSGFKPIKFMVEIDDFTVSNMSKGKHLKVIDNDTKVIFIKWNDPSWEKWGDKKKFIGVGVPDTAIYGRQKYKQLILENYTFEN